MTFRALTDEESKNLDSIARKIEAGEGVSSVENGKIALDYLEKGILWARSRAELSEVQMKCPAL